MTFGLSRTASRLWAFIKRHWLALAIAWALVATALGTWGWALTRPQPPWYQCLYLALQLFWPGQYDIPVPDPSPLIVARWIAPLLTLSAAIAAALAVFSERVQRFLAKHMGGHTVVCGLGEKGYQVVKSLRERGEKVVVIERDADNDYLPLVPQLGARAFVADATLRESLEQAGVPLARRLVAICPDDDLNVEIAYAAVRVRQTTRRGAWWRKGPTGALRCLTHVGDVDLWNLIRESSLSQDDSTAALVEFFNFDDRAAEDVVKKTLLDDYGVPRGDVRTAAVIGDGSVADRIRWHILAVPEHPPLFPPPAEVVSYDFGALMHSPSALSESMPLDRGSLVLVAMKGDRLTLHMALALEREHRSRGVRVVACTHGEAGIARAFAAAPLDAGGPLDVGGLRVHDLMESLRSPDIVLRDLLDDLGRGVHEKWLAGELENGGHLLDEAPRFCHWADLPDEWRLESLHQAADIKRKLKSIGALIVPKAKADDDFRFSREEATLLACQEHERWKASKEARGYRYGEHRDEAHKIHELLLPWDELDSDARQKNIEEIDAIPELLGECGLRIQREH